MNIESPYYPPRAGRLAPLVHLGEAFRRTFAGQGLDGLRTRLIADDVTLFGMVLSLCVPGLAFYLKGRQKVGKVAMTVCATLTIFFLVFLGYPIGNAAFACMLSIHVTGVTAYFRPIAADESWFVRLAIPLLLCAVISGVFYMPVRNWLIPLRVKGRVVVFNGLASATGIHRGAWIAFSIRSQDEYFAGEGYHGTMFVRGGLNCAPVLGVAGDAVQFSTDTFSINGAAQSRLAHMPVSGEITVPKNCWLLWPEFAMEGHGVTEGMISPLMMKSALVPETRFIGKPFRWWFWRSQSLP